MTTPTTPKMTSVERKLLSAAVPVMAELWKLPGADRVPPEAANLAEAGKDLAELVNWLQAYAVIAHEDAEELRQLRELRHDARKSLRRLLAEEWEQ